MTDRQIEIIRDEDPYSRIPKALIQDDRLRLQTRMVLIMMLSCRPDWDFSIRGMAKIAGVTKDTMSKMMAELEVAGYVKRKPQARESAGQFAKAGYLVSGKPIFLNEPEEKPCHEDQDTAEDATLPCPDPSYTDDPYTINSPQINNKQVINKQINKTPTLLGQGGGRQGRSQAKYLPELFNEFWDKEYPRHDNRIAAIRAWDKLRPDQDTYERMLVGLDRDKKSRQWQKDHGDYIPYCSSWLNQRAWENEGVDMSLLPPDPPESGCYWAPDPEVTT